MVPRKGTSMRAEELTAEFGIAGVLDFVETEHGLVKAGISLDGVTGELYLQGAQVTRFRRNGAASTTARYYSVFLTRISVVRVRR
jgi:hypothetical protein